LHGNFLDMEFAENFFDCSVSLHTIYHIDKDLQEAAVKKLLAVTKLGAPVIIVYSNPRTLISRIFWFRRLFKLFSRSAKKSGTALQAEHDLYYFAHSLDWWERFRDNADVQIFPWRSLMSNHQKLLIPDNWLGSRMLALLYILEGQFPNFFVKNFQYPMIILKKKAKNTN